MPAKLIVSSVVLLTLWSVPGFAAETSTVRERGIVNNINKTEDIGVGLQAGSLPGINLEYWVAAFRTWNAALVVEHRNTGASFGHHWMFRDAFGGNGYSFTPYLGAGVLAVFGKNSDSFDRAPGNTDSFALAAQAPVGIEFLPRSLRFGIFAQIAPSLELVPISVGFLTGDVGARFYF